MTERCIPLLFLAPALLHDLHGLGGKFLAEHTFHDVLFAGHPIADHDHYAAGDVACDGAAEDNCCQCEGAHVVVYTPGASTQGDLQHGVAVEHGDDGAEQTEGKGVVGDCLVWLVEGV